MTDSHDGALLGNDFGFTAAASLDAHPARVRKMVAKHRLTLTAVCAHPNLLDPTSPDTYGTAQIIKAIRLARDLGVKQVITTEGDPKADFGENLSGARSMVLRAFRGTESRASRPPSRDRGTFSVRQKGGGAG